jgi:hypothetical protein
MESGLPYDPAGLSPLEGELFASHRKRLNKMVDWPANPFKSLIVAHTKGRGFHFAHRPQPAAAPEDDSLYRHRDANNPRGPFYRELAKWREEARQRATEARKANPGGDFWTLAKWLEENYDVVSGTTADQTKQQPKATSKKAKKQHNQKQTARTAARMEAYCGYSSNDGSDAALEEEKHASPPEEEQHPAPPEEEKHAEDSCASSSSSSSSTTSSSAASSATATPVVRVLKQQSMMSMFAKKG